MINKPAAARKRFVFVSELETNIYKVIAGAGCEVVSVNITGGSSSCVFRLLDAAQYSSGYNLESGPSFGCRSSESFSPNLNQPIPFTKGVIIVCEQGIGSNAECMVTLNGN